MVEKNPEAGEQLDKAFKDADSFIKTYKDPSVKLSNDERLKFYALFKQATTGECKGKYRKKHIIIINKIYRIITIKIKCDS